MVVDVSKCKYYYKHTKICLARSDYMCRYKNCSEISTNDCYYKQFQQLKAENETLTEQLDDEMLKTVQLANEIVELNKYIDRAGIIGIIKVLKCLDDIEEIATVGYEGFCPKCSKKDCEDNNCYETAIIDILEKIKEVKRNRL